MRRHRITASRIALARRCSWWARPDVDLPEGESSPATDLGTALHALAEQESAAAAGDDDLDEAAVEGRFRQLVCGEAEEQAGAGLAPTERAALGELAAAWRAWWGAWPHSGAPAERERALALDVATGAARPLVGAAHRDYADATPDEVPGTLDLQVDALEQPIVVDYKTGRGPHEVDDHVDQLTHGAACVARITGAQRVIVAIAWVTPEGVRWSERKLDAFDVAVFVEELRRMIAGLPKARPRPGLHCDALYCPARSVCPATRALLLEAQVPLEARRRLPLVGPVKTEEQAFAILVAAPLLQSWIGERIKAAKTFADEHDGVRDPGSGKVYKGRPQKRETPRLDVQGAFEALRGVLPPEVVHAAVKTTSKTSFDALGKALRAAKVQGAKDLEQQVREALRRAGALKVTEFKQYEWKKESAT
ncbi:MULTISPECIES: PD-(D/E)XK nuclease family protein [Sorangium]|uniref:PD-(D/E)XK endonuclease-like domain-containing protein n=1 Tax=Sorangium cellulosum TaxID=56 RepID=A0A4P2QE71_SORCE|nr:MULTISPECIES: PD-(D/E)XK nuclease family protein [Sorangium]AUX28117.1 uncharacterized protein SOCE836_001850 [Sorangium cellulosum]WCQ87521.1 exonuclease [Sorangium sp. Soce836]